jgi:hypothetical protein
MTKSFTLPSGFLLDVTVLNNELILPPRPDFRRVLIGNGYVVDEEQARPVVAKPEEPETKSNEPKPQQPEVKQPIKPIKK